MKTFTVVVATPSGLNLPEVVEADYVKNENGVLLFKREVRHSYPEVIKAFAPGRWLEFSLA
ncbi:hypothetical protein [Tardiphaga sp. 367_B4_N1_1]|uniref:hypothetical protein n=1 Tax=Tardiphaga sp. 367_B4_N1_1 TaxID=3240777 RepID=UPI003F270707